MSTKFYKKHNETYMGNEHTWKKFQNIKYVYIET